MVLTNTAEKNVREQTSFAGGNERKIEMEWQSQ